MTESGWWVYIIRASDDSLYTGITTDVERRFEEHLAASGVTEQPGNIVRKKAKGARYFYGRRPLEVVYRESGHDRGSASRREAAIKKLNRQQKLLLIGGDVE